MNRWFWGYWWPYLYNIYIYISWAIWPRATFHVGPKIAFTISIMVTHTGYLLKCSAVGFPFQNLVMDQLLSCAKLFASFNACKQNPSNTINSRTKCWQHQFENPLTKDNLTISNMAPSKKKAPRIHVKNRRWKDIFPLRPFSAPPRTRSRGRGKQSRGTRDSPNCGPSGAESESTGDKNHVPSGNLLHSYWKWP